MSAVTDSDRRARGDASSRNGHKGQPNLPGFEPSQLDYESRVIALRALVTGQSSEYEFWHEVDGKRFDGLTIGLDEEGRLWGATWATWLEGALQERRQEERAARVRQRAEEMEEARRRIHAFREGSVTDTARAVAVSLEAVTTLERAIKWDQPIPHKRVDMPNALQWIMWRAKDGAGHDEEPCGFCAGRSPRYYRSMCDEHLLECFRREVRERIWECTACGRGYLSRRRWEDRVGYCSDECEVVTKVDAARARRTDSRNALGLRCQVCDEVIDAGRSDARYCSPACRQKAYRSRRTRRDPARTL
ncbi:MAG TPA: hypothetical protein VFA08_09170 [Actinomycetota bacterium]|nr:hypothetical protein [Actinomycetota bacterium]